MNETTKPLFSTVNRAIRSLERTLGINSGDIDIDFIDHSYEEIDESEIDISADDQILLSLPRCEADGITLTCGELEALAEEISKSELKHHLECWTPKRCLVRVEMHGSRYEANFKLEQIVDNNTLIPTVKVDGCTYKFSLCVATTPFGFLVVKSSYWDKYYPPVLEEDLFIEVQWDGKHDPKVVDNLLNSLIFELSSSHGIFLRRAPRLHESDEVEPEAEISQLRPLLNGDGLSEVLSLYSNAIATEEPEFRIIGMVKVLEHISTTVVREDLSQQVRSKLQSSRALSPDASFIMDLEVIISTHSRQHRKDSDALRLTIQKCCDSTELARTCPARLQLARIAVGAKEKDKESALSEFASALSATRNQIVHAKLNYEATGSECQSSELPALAETCRIAAEQAVRWFSIQHPSIRLS